ncbi:MAG TPA: phasin family protein [Desulfobacteraceae bacterium]|nr:phasin family protein [Desulfobacteraceae bacterium]HPJ67001.1 phasin family protein [Desulfobacteraceae bacterium]HPQ27267.1 phasin family protein [Desulfobacteraceae bacterium]
MLDLLKKTLMTGVGLAVITKDKIEELVKEIIEKGEISEQEGKELIEKLQKKSDQARKDLEEKIERIVQKTLEKMNIPTKKDITDLEERIKAIEKK